MGQQLVLDFFVLTVDKDENVTRAEVCRVRPALDGTVKRVRRRGNNFLVAHENVRQLGRLVDIGVNNLFQPSHLIPYNTVRMDIPPKGRKKHPLGIWIYLRIARSLPTLRANRSVICLKSLW